MKGTFAVAKITQKAMTKLLSQVTDELSTMRSEKASVKTYLVRIFQRVCTISLTKEKRKEKYDKTADITYFFGTMEWPLVTRSARIHELLTRSSLICHGRDQIENLEVEKVDCIQLWITTNDVVYIRYCAGHSTTKIYFCNLMTKTLSNKKWKIPCCGLWGSPAPQKSLESSKD